MILLNQEKSWQQELSSRLATHVWIKMIGTTGFMALFFWAYLHLLHHPLYPVWVMPVTPVDRWIGFMPEALPLYLSLWLYVSLPTAFIKARRDLLRHGAYVGGLCLSGVMTFLLWPTAIPVSDPVWGAHPGIAVLSEVDAAGNACPSLHVATAVFSAVWLSVLLREIGVPSALRRGNWVWCLGIVYSTLAIRQHVFIDVVSGAVLGAVFGALSLRQRALRGAALAPVQPAEGGR